MKNLFSFSAVVIAAMVACKPVKKIQTVIVQQDTAAVVKISDPKVDSGAIKKSILDKVHSNHIDFKYFAGKMKVDFVDGKGKKTDVNANVRIRKDSVIWISITAQVMGLEGARVLVKPDTVIILDKMNNKVMYRSTSYLKDMFKLPVDFSTLQDLLVGNPVFFPDNIQSYSISGSQLQAQGVGEFFKHLITIDTTDNRILHSKLDDAEPGKTRTCDIYVDGYEKVQGRLFGKLRQITVADSVKIELHMEYKQQSFDEPQSFPFNIPKNYETK